jgi:hypothetical protein
VNSSEDLGDVTLVLHGVDASEQRLDRGEVVLLLGRLVDTASIEVADLLLIRTSRRFGLLGRFKNGAHGGQVVVTQLGKGAPGRVFRGNGICLHPAAHGESEKVITGLAGAIQIVERKSPTGSVSRCSGRKISENQKSDGE